MKPNPRDPTTGAVMESPSRISANVGHGPIRPVPSTSSGKVIAGNDSARMQGVTSAVAVSRLTHRSSRRR